MHIGIAGLIATENIAHLLAGDTSALPAGYDGAPLLATLIDELLALGHQVSAFTTTTGYPQAEYKAVHACGDSFSIYYVPARPRAFHPEGGHLGRVADMFRAERLGLERAMREAKPDVIHAHWACKFGLATTAAELPHIITAHDAPQVVLRHTPNLYRLVRYFMSRRCFAQARYLTAVSPYMCDRVAHWARVPIAVVPNPLPQMLTGGKVDLSHLPDPCAPHLAMVANGWGPIKNPQPAMRAFARLHARVPGARLRLYGSDFGPDQTAEKWAQQQDISAGMEFVGSIPYARLLDELASADVLLHPALEESFGMSVAEAMALGVPVTGGARSGAVPWVIGDGGLVTVVGSEIAIAKALDTLLFVPEEYSRRRHAAVKRAQEFSVNHVADRYVNHYCEAMDRAESQYSTQR